MMAGARFDVSRRVQDISSPALVLHGSEDQVVPLDNAEALARAIPNAGLRVVEGAGHLVFIERADEVNEEILSFLQANGRPSPAGGLVTGVTRLHRPLSAVRRLMRV
jgi:3-oxoadipate enol-lactonase